MICHGASLTSGFAATARRTLKLDDEVYTPTPSLSLQGEKRFIIVLAKYIPRQRPVYTAVTSLATDSGHRSASLGISVECGKSNSRQISHIWRATRTIGGIVTMSDVNAITSSPGRGIQSTFRSYFTFICYHD